MSELIIFQPDLASAVPVRLEGETVWLTQVLLAAVFGRECSVIAKHLRNIFKEEEQGEKSNVQILHIAGATGKPISCRSVCAPAIGNLCKKCTSSIRYRSKSIASINGAAMNTFCAVNEQLLIEKINAARQRIVFIAPGIYLPVATALGRRFQDVADLDVTVVLDHSDEVCRLGYGELAGLEHLQGQANQQGFWLRSQIGLRVGVLLVDDETLIWSPTPQSIEAPPGEDPDDLLAAGTNVANGLMIGRNPREQISKAVVAEGENLDPRTAEIGQKAVTPDDVARTQAALKRNPAVSIDIQRITRVYSTKLQFVELKVRNAKISRSQFSLSNELLNADAKDELKGLLDSKLRAFADLREEAVSVPVFIDGEQVFNSAGKPILSMMTEADLEAIRRDIERKYTYDILGFGRLIAREEKPEYEAQIAALKAQLIAHSEGIKALLDSQSDTIITEAVELIQARLKTASKQAIDAATLKTMIEKGMQRARTDSPEISLVFKDITYEQTQNDDFLQKVQKALPATKRKQLGAISEHNQAALAKQPQ